MECGCSVICVSWLTCIIGCKEYWPSCHFFSLFFFLIGKKKKKPFQLYKSNTWTLHTDRVTFNQVCKYWVSLINQLNNLDTIMFIFQVLQQCLLCQSWWNQHHWNEPTWVGFPVWFKLPIKCDTRHLPHLLLLPP